MARNGEGGDDAMVKNRAKDGTVASGGDDAIIPSRRKRDDVKTRGTMMTSLRHEAVRGAPSVQHRNAVLHHTILLHVSAPGGWDACERGVVECIADIGCTATV